MKLKPFAELIWGETIAQNASDEYGRAVNDFAETWASDCERQFEGTTNNQEVVRAARLRALETYNLSSYQYNIASQLLLALWEHGETIKRLLEAEGGTTENPVWELPKNAKRISADEFDSDTLGSTEKEITAVDGHVFLDLNQPVFDKAFNDALRSPVQKSIPVRATQVFGYERVLTIIDGKIEAENEAHPTDWKITNPGGEQYVVPDERFRKLYEDKGDGTFIGAAKRLLIHNPTGYPVAVRTPWDKNSVMYGDRHSLFVADVIGTGEAQSAGDERYLIARSEAAITYGRMLVAYSTLQV